MIPLPWLAGGAVAVSVALFGFGYLKGHTAAKTDCLAGKAEALSRQAIELRQEHQLQVEALKKRAERQKHVDTIAEIERPTTALCDASEWVRPISEAVRAANAAAQPD